MIFSVDRRFNSFVNSPCRVPEWPTGPASHVIYAYLSLRDYPKLEKLGNLDGRLCRVMNHSCDADDWETPSGQLQVNAEEDLRWRRKVTRNLCSCVGNAPL